LVFRSRAFPDIEKLEKKRDVEGLIKALRHEDVRLEAVTALGRIGKPAVEPLIQALNDDNEGVRMGAKKALEKIKAKKS